MSVAGMRRNSYRPAPQNSQVERTRVMTHVLHSPPSAMTIVVLPCFNEARRLDIPAFDAFFGRCFDVSLLLVDDGSTDDTPLVMERLRQRHPKRMLTLRLGSNVGKAEAVRRGMQIAIRRRAAIAGYWDADLATPLELITRLRAVLEERPELQLVMGSRVALLGRQIERRWRRHLLGRAFATAASYVLRLPVYDTQCGAKLFRVTPETADVFRTPFHSRWIFDVEILSRMLRHAGQDTTDHSSKWIYEYPLERWREVSGSRLKAMDFAVAAIDLAGIYWRGRGGDAPRGATVQSPAVGIEHRDAA
jgi:dolichyl-phosphate beta-glucosyltransferase